MDGIEYIFGSGDGAYDTWTTPADLDLDADGVLDAVALDFDGDGLLDDALWDSDLDGVADRVAVDGGAHWHTDPAEDGTWTGYQVAEEIPAGVIPAGSPTVVADPAPGVLVDTNGDGILDTALTDVDGDGLLDTASAADVRLRGGDWSQWGASRR